jgi:peptide/nickel transport system ATP-binding protein
MHGLLFHSTQGKSHKNSIGEMNPLLSIQQLSVVFKTESGRITAVKNVSFDLQRGEIVAVVGESGSGKSVTALSILQLLASPPAEYKDGRILFSPDDQAPFDLLRLPLKELRKIRGKQISFIFQEPMTSLNPVFTCGNQVLESIRQHERCSESEAKTKTIALFDRVKLPSPSSIYHRYPHQLSGGQKQRVMIAMAMSCNPSLLICDEPTTALDVTVQKTILDLIKELQRETGMGVLFISHDLGLVADFADRCVVMLKGKVVEQGITSELFERPQHPYTEGLLACRPVLHKKGERLPTVADFMGEEFDLPETRIQKQPSGILKESVGVTESKETLIQVDDLSVWFPTSKNFFGKALGYVKAVDQVSFEVFKGETLGLVGESGCGKTTLGRALLRLIRPTSGSIIFNGNDLVKMKPTELRILRREIQIVFQDPYSSLNPRITIGEAIGEPLEVHELVNKKVERKRQVMHLLEQVNLNAALYNRYPHEFSGGQRQRIVIARALAMNPTFVVCDESVSALDVSVQAQVLNLLNDLKKEFGFTVIFISHDLSVVHYLSDRIMVMNKGRIEEIGEAEQVYYRPVSDYTRKLISSIPGTKVS